MWYFLYHFGHYLNFWLACNSLLKSIIFWNIRLKIPWKRENSKTDNDFYHFCEHFQNYVNIILFLSSFLFLSLGGEKWWGVWEAGQCPGPWWGCHSGAQAVSISRILEQLNWTERAHFDKLTFMCLLLFLILKGSHIWVVSSEHYTRKIHTLVPFYGFMMCNVDTKWNFDNNK